MYNLLFHLIVCDIFQFEKYFLIPYLAVYMRKSWARSQVQLFYRIWKEVWGKLYLGQGGSFLLWSLSPKFPLLSLLFQRIFMMLKQRLD
jgi:hypothetical protein